MVSHVRPKPSRIPRTLLRAGLAVSAVGAALAAGGTASAGAATAPVPTAAPDQGAGGTVSALTGVVRKSVDGAPGAVRGMQLNPLANTPVDPLNNDVGTEIADFKSVSTKTLTGPVSRGATVGDLPVVGSATKLMPG
ncbi:hypothetical protein AB0I10_33505 [Streptomyces sp. NPDC050636]|uniref:hypothetical protein n=1 Tax=Streptomyces sp. NPDC050636 TaxID=3154510 RepID=UPI00343E6291